MRTLKDELSFPYKATSAETVDLLTGIGARLCYADAPLGSIAEMAEVVEDGAMKHAKGDWRTKPKKWFIMKALRHMAASCNLQLTLTDETIGDCEGVQVDPDSDNSHLVRAAVNLLMAAENEDNFTEDETYSVAGAGGKQGLIYLASPYSINPEVSLVVSSTVARSLINKGRMVYSPIVYGHTLAPGASWEYWMGHCKKMLAACDELWVIDHHPVLGPASKSKGCKAETDLASELGIPVKYLTLEKDSAW